MAVVGFARGKQDIRALQHDERGGAVVRRWLRASASIAAVAAATSLSVAAGTRLPMEQLAAGSFAARAVDGARIASDRCYSCHMVRQSKGTNVAPTFAEIAVQRTPGQIRAFLANPHGGMPIQLSNDQIEDVIAYMKSLNPGSDIAPQQAEGR